MDPRPARAARIAFLSIALGLGAPASGEPTAEFRMGGRFVPPAVHGNDAVFTQLIAWTVPIADVAALFGLTPGDFDWSYPSLTVSVWIPPGERARVEAFAMAWMYVYRQDWAPRFVAPGGGRPVMRLRYEEAGLPPHDWRADPDGTALLTAIRRLHAAPGIEIKLRALRARYDGIVSRWLTQRFRPCCLAS